MITIRPRAVKVIPLKAEHVIELRDRGALTYLTNSVTNEKLKLLEQQRYSFTLIGEFGQILCCGGIIEFWTGRGEAWAFFDQNLKFKFVPIHRAVKNFLHFVPIQRIEATVDYDFKAGHRWIRMLGFQLECKRMERYGVGGIDASRYILLKDV